MGKKNHKCDDLFIAQLSSLHQGCVSSGTGLDSVDRLSMLELDHSKHFRERLRKKTSPLDDIQTNTYSMRVYHFRWPITMEQQITIYSVKHRLNYWKCWAHFAKGVWADNWNLGKVQFPPIFILTVHLLTILAHIQLSLYFQNGTLNYHYLFSVRTIFSLWAHKNFVK